MGIAHRCNRNAVLALALAGALAAVLAACGSSGSATGTTGAGASATTNGGGGSDTVSVRSIGGVGRVLVDSSGMTLYTNNQDSRMTVACTGACAQIWVPLTVPAGTKATSPDPAIQDKLGAVQDPDGKTQVTFDAKPLYTFVQDSAGTATGDGSMDSFGGTSFTWTAATVPNSGSSAGAAGGAPSGTSGSGRYGGSSTGGGGSYGY